MKARPSPIIFVPGAVAVLAFAAYAVLWNAGAGAMRKSVTAWTEDVRENGGTASFDAFRATGFPFLLRGVVTTVLIGDKSWSWSAPTLYIDASPFSADRLIFSVREPHTIDLKAGGRWRIDAPDGRASIASDKARGWLLDAQSGPGSLSRDDGAARISASSFLLSAAPDAANGARVFLGLEAKGVVAERGGVARIDVVEIALAVDGLAQTRSVRDWRDAGGRVDVQRLHFEAGGGKVDVVGAIALDTDGYPTGTLAAQIVNPAFVVQALSAAGVISSDDAAKAAAGLTLAAIAGGGKIAAPLVLRDRAAHVATVRLGSLPRLLRDEAIPQIIPGI